MVDQDGLEGENERRCSTTVDSYKSEPTANQSEGKRSVPRPPAAVAAMGASLSEVPWVIHYEL